MWLISWYIPAWTFFLEFFHESSSEGQIKFTGLFLLSLLWNKSFNIFGFFNSAAYFLIIKIIFEFLSYKKNINFVFT